MKFARQVAVLILLGASAAAQTSASANYSVVEHSLTFLRTPDATGNVSEERVRTCLRLLVREMNVAGKDLPHILVIHASRKAAHAVGLTNTGIRRNSAPGTSDSYYEFWILGQPTLADYTVGLGDILNQHFQLHLADTDRKQIMVRVLRFLRSTVDVHSNG